jgi:hypothetical protein
LSNGISDISGVTGQVIIRAILSGEQDPATLVKLRNRRIKATQEEVACSLEGAWREDMLCEQAGCYGLRFHAEADKRIRPALQTLIAELPARKMEAAGVAVEAPGKPPKRSGPTENRKTCRDSIGMPSWERVAGSESQPRYQRRQSPEAGTGHSTTDSGKLTMN